MSVLEPVNCIQLSEEFGATFKYLGQAWYRNIQKLGLDTDSEIGK
jgi:hypothetical protein